MKNYKVNKGKTWIKSLIILISIIVYFACSDDNDVKGPVPTPYNFPDIEYFPEKLNIPDDNPTTMEGVELGRYLFYDGRLSGRSHPDSLMSCATCHIQKKGFEVGIDHPKYKGGFPHGLPTKDFPEGIPTPHTTLPLINLVYQNTGYLWNGWVNNNNNNLGSKGYGVPALPEFNFKNIESVTWMAITAPHEINGVVATTVKLISTDPMYPPMFNRAFGSEDITYDRISKAIAQFVRTIISYRSKYHKYLRGEAQLTEQELRGQTLFFSEDADCFHCHGGSVLMTTGGYFNNGKDVEFTDPRDRYAVTGDPFDIGAYKAPSLINVELNGPYMHDGRFKTLDEVIDFYSEGVVYNEHIHPLMKYVRFGGVRMTDQEKADLKAFLLALTDHDLLNDQSYSCPEKVKPYYIDYYN